MPLALLAIVIASAAPGASAQKRSEPLVSKAALSDAIEAGVGYLTNAVDERGKFTYRINLDPSLPVEEKYNILRHAGAIYALAEAYERQPDPEILAAMTRAGGFMKAEAIAGVPGEEDLLAVWSRDSLNKAGKPEQAKLGGAGLGLVALVSLERLSPGSTEIEDLRSIARFILFMQKKDGSFYSKYYAGRGRDDSWTSLFYPGEAALGLLMLHEIDPNPAWVAGAADALDFLARSREGRPSVPIDHWALIASERLLALDQGDGSVDRELIEAHAAQIVEEILRSRPALDEKAPIASFVADGRTTPTATRVEGLVAALNIIPEDRRALRRRSRHAIEEGVAFLVRAQVRDGPHRGATPRALRRLSLTPDNANFNRRASEVRIDYVQHSLSAFIGFEDALKAATQ
ncbi:MAG: hypothetical protein AAFX08_08045 [Pseudomonadota bacterium]